VAACDLHDDLDRVDNNLWLLDRDNVTGPSSRDHNPRVLTALPRLAATVANARPLVAHR
jgi:hypothetical protein